MKIAKNLSGQTATMPIDRMNRHNPVTKNFNDRETLVKYLSTSCRERVVIEISTDGPAMQGILQALNDHPDTVDVTLVAHDKTADAAAGTHFGLANASEVARLQIAQLTQRERDILVGLFAGASNKVLAFDLGLSIRTIEMHRAGMMARLGVRTLPEALKIAFDAGMMSIPNH